MKVTIKKIHKQKCQTNSSHKKNKPYAKIINLLGFLITLIISIISLVIAYNSMKISNLMYKSNSLVSEPIINVTVNANEEILYLQHSTWDIYQILHVDFAKVVPIMVSQFKDKTSKMSVIEIQEKIVRENLERGHTIGTDTPPKVASAKNKKLELRMEHAFKETNKQSLIGDIHKEIKLMIDDNSNLYFNQNHYPYYYVRIFYKDIYGNRYEQFYIYQITYGSANQLYKMNEEEFHQYTKFLIDERDKSSKELTDILLSNDNFIDIKNTKYYNYYYDTRYCNEFFRE